jgi:hypothetical protein
MNAPALSGAPGVPLALGLAVAFLASACTPSDAPPGPEGGAPRVQPLEAPFLDAFPATADPALARDPATGEVLVAFGAAEGSDAESPWNLHFVRVTADGAPAGNPVQVNDRPGDLHPHAEGAPRLVVAGEALTLFWNNRIEAPGRRFAASDLRFARSIDGGSSWSAATNLQDPRRPAELPPRAHTFHGAAWSPEAGLVVAWLDGRERDARRLERADAQGIPPAEAARTPEEFGDPYDLRDGDATVFAAVSPDGGTTWESGNRRIEGEACPCCRIDLAVAPDGSIHGGWRRHLDGGIRDLVVTRVAGVAAEPPPASTPIHPDRWVIAGCPHSGPALDFAPDGALHASWYTGAEGRPGVYYAIRPAGSERFGPPVPVAAGPHVGVAHPAVLAVPGGGAILAHNVDSEGRRVIVISRIDPDGTLAGSTEVPGSEGGTHPQLAALGSGHILAAWTEVRGGVPRIRMARVAAEARR